MRVRKLALLCALISSVSLAACNKAVAIATVTGPSGLPQCSDGQNNDPWEDDLKDSADPGCHSDGNAGNPKSYDPNDNDERDNPGAPTSTPPPSGNPPGGFQLNNGVCQGSIAKLSWTASSGAEYYQIWQQLFTSGSPRLVKDRVSTNILNLDLQADASSTNYWKVVAVNSRGQTTATVAPGVRTDVPGMVFACGAPAPPPPPVSTTPTPTPGGGTNPPGTTTPPSGGSCGGASASLPDLTTRGQNAAFVITAPTTCHWVLTSDNTHVVSVNPAEGYGAMSGQMAAASSLPGASGQSTVVVKFNGVVFTSKTYTIR